MRAMEMKDQLLSIALANSGFEVRRYLSMSRIGYCPLELYRDLAYGRRATNQDHLKLYMSRLFRQDILRRLDLIDSDLLSPGRELTGFDGRFRGHTDGEWHGDLLVVKAVASDRMPYNGQVPQAHYWQTQCYMRYGRYEGAKMVYVAMDTGDLWTFHVSRSYSLGDRAREKAEFVLKSVDRRQPPVCECGRCSTINNEQ